MKKIKRLYKNILWLMNNDIKKINETGVKVSGSDLKMVIDRSQSTYYRHYK